MAVHHHVGARLEKRKVGGPATARRRSVLGNRRWLNNGQLNSPSCSGRRFASFQRQRAPAGPQNSGFRAYTPRTLYHPLYTFYSVDSRDFRRTQHSSKPITQNCRSRLTEGIIHARAQMRRARENGKSMSSTVTRSTLFRGKEHSGTQRHRTPFLPAFFDSSLPP